MSLIDEQHEAAWKFDRHGIESPGGFPSVDSDPAFAEAGCQGCEETDVPLKLVAVQREEGGEWFGARWCTGEDSCLEMARMALAGETSYGAAGLEPVHALVVWSEHTFRCSLCKRTCRVDEAVIAQFREDYAWDSPDPSDAEVAASLEFCLWCVENDLIPGEHVHGAPPREEG